MRIVRFQSYPSLVGLTLRERQTYETYEYYYTLLHETMTFDELCTKIWLTYKSPNPATPRPPEANEIAYALIRLIDCNLVCVFEDFVPGMS